MIIAYPSGRVEIQVYALLLRYHFAARTTDVPDKQRVRYLCGLQQIYLPDSAPAALLVQLEHIPGVTLHAAPAA